MKDEEFVQAVKERAGIAEGDEAWRTAVTVLQALCDRLTRDEAHDLLAQLPARLKTSVVVTRAVMPMTPEEFVERVARELDVPPEEAKERVRAVFATIRRAVSWGEFEDVVVQLEPGYADLFA